MAHKYQRSLSMIVPPSLRTALSKMPKGIMTGMPVCVRNCLCLYIYIHIHIYTYCSRSCCELFESEVRDGGDLVDVVVRRLCERGSRDISTFLGVIIWALYKPRGPTRRGTATKNFFYETRWTLRLFKTY